MATMVPNQILQRMARGEKALGMTLKETSGLLVELAGRCGLDFVSFDGQHDTVSPAEIGEMCRIADAYGMTVSMRIPDGAESTILSYLDRGVRVITIPNLLTAGFSVFDLTKDAIAELLQKHGRQTKLGW